jgi:hypothetical protein
MLVAGAGEGVSRLMMGGGLTVSPGMTTSSSSSSELSKVRSITGPFAEAGLAIAGVGAIAAAAVFVFDDTEDVDDGDDDDDEGAEVGNCAFGAVVRMT